MYFTKPMGFCVVSNIFLISAMDWLFAEKRKLVKSKRKHIFFTLKILKTKICLYKEDSCLKSRLLKILTIYTNDSQIVLLKIMLQSFS